jgi:hypothetical protein
MPSTRPKRPQSLPPKPTDQRISLKQAVEYTKRYQRSAPASEKAGFFYLTGLKALLGQNGVFGMRIYHGLDADGRYRMVLVGVDKDGTDITGSTSKTTATEVAVLLDGHYPCPPFCPRDSPL